MVSDDEPEHFIGRRKVSPKLGDAPARPTAPPSFSWAARACSSSGERSPARREVTRQREWFTGRSPQAGVPVRTSIVRCATVGREHGITSTDCDLAAASSIKSDDRRCNRRSCA
jgi:hypothetical protein